jgi:uncharacterized coiled-coil protein SlyX
MNRQEREEYVTRLYNEGRNTRDIAKLARMSLRDIGPIIKKVKLEADLPANQVRAIYREYWELEGMYGLSQICDEAIYDLHDLLRLHKIVKDLGMNEQDIISAFELIKHNQLQTLQWKAGYLRSEINTLEWKKRNSTYRLSNLERTINEYEETLAQKRAEMAYLNRETRKLRQRFIDYSSHNLRPIAHSEPDANSDSTQIVPYNKE